MRTQSGQILPLVMVAMAVGSLLIVPSLGYVSTHVNAGATLEQNIKALYAADAGIEDALWHLMNVPAEQWQSEPWWDPTKGLDLTDFNGMNVKTTVSLVQYIGGEKATTVGTHQDWLTIEGAATYTEISEYSGIYNYTLNITDFDTPKNMNISWLKIDFPAGMGYVLGSFTSNMGLTEPTSSANLMLSWGEIGGKQLFTIQGSPKEPVTYTLTLQLEGPPVEGHLENNVAMYVQDEIKFLTQSWPLVVVATASDANGAVHATITAGISVLTSVGPEIQVRSWNISR